MYCKVCGTKNSSFAQFCFNDGVRLSKETEPVFSQHTYADFCSKCGEKTSKHAQHCRQCGHAVSSITTSVKKGIQLKVPQSFSTVTSSTQRFTDQAVGKAKNWFSAAEWNRLFIGTGVMALTWLVIVFVLFLSAKSVVEKAFRKNLSLEEWLEFSRFFDSFGFFQYASLIATRSITGDISLSDSYGDTENLFSGTVTAGSIMPLLFLFIAVLAGSFVALYKSNTESWNWPQFVQVSALFGLAYSVMTTFILLIGGGNITTVTEFVQFSADLSFSPFSAFIYNFIFAFVLSVLALILASGAFKTTHFLRSSLYVDAAIRGAGSFLIGLIVTTIAGAVFLYSSMASELKEEEVPGTPIYLVEAASAFYPLYHFSVLHGEGSFGEEMEFINVGGRAVSLGLFSEETMIEKMVAEGSSEGMFAYPDDLPFIANWGGIYLLILVPAALFFLNGWLTGSPARQLPVKAALVFSGVYTFLVLMLAYWKGVSFHMEVDYGSTVMNFSSPLVTTAFVTFLFSCALFMLGAYIKQRRGGSVH